MTPRYAGPPATVECGDCGFTRTCKTPGIAAKALQKHSCDHQRKLAARAQRVQERREYEGEKRDCTCKRAKHEHGTRTAYVVDKCRCRPCITAATQAENKRQKQQAFGRYDSGRVDAQPVREHIQFLMDNGISVKRIAKLSGVSLSAVGAVRWGRSERGHAPYPRVHRATAEKILAVKPTIDNMADGRCIDATGSHRRIQALVAIGWSQSRLAVQLGMNRANFGTFMKAEQCTVRTAKGVREIYRRSWDQPQTGHDWHSKTSATRARNLAQAYGWVPPLAWDDDTIDDPAALPETGERIKRGDALLEDIEFMILTGASMDEIAKRAGMTWKSVEKALYRAGRGELVGTAKNDQRDNARKAGKARAAA